jgi:hypothetical protein
MNLSSNHSIKSPEKDDSFYSIEISPIKNPRASPVVAKKEEDKKVMRPMIRKSLKE